MQLLQYLCVFTAAIDGLSGGVGVRNPPPPNAFVPFGKSGMLSYHSVNLAIFSYHSVNSAIVLFPVAAFLA